MTIDNVSNGPLGDPQAAAKDAGKPCIALMGEFSAGKTTLINFLVGQEVLPTKVTATQVPPVWLSHGSGAPFYVDSDNQQHPVSLDDIQSLNVKAVRYIKIFAQADFLRHFDLIDTPGISDPNIPEFHRDTAIDNADLVVWCTHATQAWRASEQSAWSQVPDALKARSILLATRADKLDERNRGRVSNRLVHEAGALFAEIIMFSATDALKAKRGDGAPDLMDACGGTALMTTLARIAGLDDGPLMPGAAGDAVPDALPAEAPAAPRVQPTRVTRKRENRRERITAEKAELVRSRVLNVTEAGDMARLWAKAQELERAASGEADVTSTAADMPTAENDDQIADSLEVAPAPSDEDLSAGILSFESHGDAEDAPALTDDQEPDSPDDDLECLLNLQEMFKEEIVETAPDDMPEEDDAAVQPDTALSLWQQVVDASEIATVPDILQAVSDWIAQMQARQLGFTDESAPEDTRAGLSRLRCG